MTATETALDLGQLLLQRASSNTWKPNDEPRFSPYKTLLPLPRTFQYDHEVDRIRRGNEQSVSLKP